MKKGILEFGMFLVLLLSLDFPEIHCQIGRGYQENHPNHVLGSQQLQQQLRYEESIATTIQTPQTGKNYFCFLISKSLSRFNLPL